MFFVVALAILIPLDLLAAIALARIHPRWKWAAAAVAVVCNLLWIFLPWLTAGTAFARVLRATLGPPWFGWLCFAVVYCAFLAVVALAWFPFFRRISFAAFARWPSRVFLSATAIVIVAGVYTALVPLDVRRVPVMLRDLPPELNGTRIVLLADLHVGLFTRPSRLRRIFETAGALRPDLVLLAGDLIDDDPAFVPKLLAGTRWLNPSTPLIAVLGNHEMYGAPRVVIGRLRASRIHLLVNEGANVHGIWIAGLSDYAARTPDLRPDFSAALAGRPPDAFPIVVSHQPRSFPESIRRALPLTLCGHSHGGQCGFRPQHWSLAGLFIPYHMGLYRRGASQLYVNTGTGYWLLPWRLGLEPEITVIELRALR